jgi:hypothetical protein
MNKEKVYEIGQAYIRLDFKATDEFKEAFEQFLLYKGKQYAKEYFKKEFLIDGFYFTVELEDGSLKSRLKIFGKIAIGSLIAYGGIRTGIDYVIKDAQTITEHIARDVANEPNIGNNRIGRVERRLGVPGKIKRLYNDIDKLRANRNNLTPNEQQEILDRIQRQFEDLVLELDQPELQVIQEDLIQYQIPLPERQDNQDLFLPRQYAIREDEIRLISEDEIQQPRQLPLPRQ